MDLDKSPPQKRSADELKQDADAAFRKVYNEAWKNHELLSPEEQAFFKEWKQHTTIGRLLPVVFGAVVAKMSRLRGWRGGAVGVGTYLVMDAIGQQVTSRMAYTAALRDPYMPFSVRGRAVMHEIYPAHPLLHTYQTNWMFDYGAHSVQQRRELHEEVEDILADFSVKDSKP